MLSVCQNCIMYMTPVICISVVHFCTRVYKLRDMVNYEDELVQNLLRIRVALLREQCVYNTKYKKQHCLAMWDAVFIKCVTV